MLEALFPSVMRYRRKCMKNAMGLHFSKKDMVYVLNIYLYISLIQ